jgi:protein gp37
MSEHSNIEWTDATWPVVAGCGDESPGCLNCFAKRDSHRLAGNPNPKVSEVYSGTTERRAGGPIRWTGLIRPLPERLGWPLKWRKPRRVFVCNESDLFHPDVPDEFIDSVFAVMGVAHWHTYQVLTKRADRMAAYANDPATPFRVAKAMDMMIVAEAIRTIPERIAPYPSFPGYFISNHGCFYTTSGTTHCLQCGAPLGDKPRTKFCGSKCRALDYYHRKQGNKSRGEGPPSFARISPDVGEKGHERVMLYRSGEQHRVLVHRAVLTVFDRPPVDDEQGCHRDGNPRNNHVANLRWGSQEDNWVDRKRHGKGRSWSKLTDQQVGDIRHLAAQGRPEYSIDRLASAFGVSDTQIINILAGRQWSGDSPLEWPLRNCWAGVSVEDQKRADERIPHLLKTPAAVRFLSCEPLLAPVDLRHVQTDIVEIDALTGDHGVIRPLQGRSDKRIHLVIVGGESGHGARPMHPVWARSIRDQCQAAGVPFFFKQWGEWSAVAHPHDADEVVRAFLDHPNGRWLEPDGGDEHRTWDAVRMVRVGKKAAGRLLDGRTWDEFPTVQSAAAGRLF